MTSPEEEGSMMEKIHRDDLPKNAQLSEDLKKKTVYFRRIMLFGINYYVPLTKDIKKLPEDSLRNIIASVFYQIRDTVGAEVQSNLSEEIHDSFNKFIQKGLNNSVNEKLDKALEIKKDEHYPFHEKGLADRAAFKVNLKLSRKQNDSQ